MGELGKLFDLIARLRSALPMTVESEDGRYIMTHPLRCEASRVLREHGWETEPAQPPANEGGRRG